MLNHVTHAAVGVLQRDDGWVLLAERPLGKPWAGWWEFPGGKIEQNETPAQALMRELKEELGVRITQVNPWLIRTFQYPEKTVQLHFFIVTQWQGEPQACEGQLLRWQNPAKLDVSPMLPANLPIMTALALPNIYAITNMAEVGETIFFAQLELALKNGLQMLQVREKQLSASALKLFAKKVIALSQAYSVKILLNGNVDLAQELACDGVHLSAQQLMTLHKKPNGLMVSASCHNLQELEHAQMLQLDFVVLSPVLPTLSHVGAEVLGWQKFHQLVVNYPLPVYALGGMSADHLAAAWQQGARGVAMQRGAWV